MANIVAVDDSAEICALIKAALEKDGHRVSVFYDAAGLDASVCARADLILLDVMMPNEDGFSACRRIRSQTDCPIIFLTAKTAEDDVVGGLGAGGDDYITKPFNIKELRARVSAHLRRQCRKSVQRLAFGDISFDLSGRELYVNGKKVPLTRGEYDVCETLARHQGLIYTREQLIEMIFGFDSESDAAAITQHIKNIRAKLADAGTAPIETVWGMGYKWKNEAD